MSDIDVIRHALGKADAEWRRVARLNKLRAGEHEAPYRPRETGSEFQRLAQRSRLNLYPLVIDTFTQCLRVSGYRDQGDGSAWAMWQQQGMDAHQRLVHDAVLAYGQALVAVRPDRDGGWRAAGMAPSRSFALFGQPTDLVPQYVVETRDTAAGRMVTLIDDVRYATYRQDDDRFIKVTEVRHGFDTCPVVRFAVDLDLEGRTHGMIEPLITAQDRVNQTVFDWLVTSSFGSFKVRTVTGLDFLDDRIDAMDDDEAAKEIARAKQEARQAKLAFSQDKMLMASDPDVRFGQLDETPIGGFLDSTASAIQQMAMMTQIPAYALSGSMINMSAEAITAAEAGFHRKISMMQTMLGESWEIVLRLFAQTKGDVGGATDNTAEVMWADVSSRSLAQAVDAWGKAVQMMGLPGDIGIEKIPGITQADLDRIPELRATDPLAAIGDVLSGQAVPPDLLALVEEAVDGDVRAGEDQAG